MRKLLIAMALVLGVATADAAKDDWKVGVQCWTYNHQTLLKTADYCAANGIKYLEIYPGQKIGGEFQGKTHHSMSKEDRGLLKKVLEQKGVKLVSYGCVKAKDEKGWDQIFSFCKDMGIDYVISEPAQDQMKTIDSMTKKYAVDLGIHNHKSPTPDEVDKRLKGMSDRVGIAPDNGHWQRHGHDTMKSLNRFEGRIKSIHLKDIKADGKDGPYGTGVTPVLDILNYLNSVDYKGPIIIEYESGNEDENVKKCNDYLVEYISGNKSCSKETESKCTSKWEYVSADDLDDVWCNYDKTQIDTGWAGFGAKMPKKSDSGTKKPKQK